MDSLKDGGLGLTVGLGGRAVDMIESRAYFVMTGTGALPDWYLETPEVEKGCL